MKFLRAVLSALPETTVLVFDRTGICRHVGKMLASLHAFSGVEGTNNGQDFVGKHYIAIVPPERLERFGRMFQHALRGVPQKTDVRAPNGAVVEKLTLPLIHNAKVIGVMLLYRDVTPKPA